MQYGSYILGDVLGRGGMGVVHKARHAVIGSPACVKLLLPELTKHPEIAARFVNEARAAAGIAHDNIVRVIDCNQAGDGVWYIALEYLDGVPLSKWLRGGTAGGVAPRLEAHPGRGDVLPAQACRILVQAASALHAAHEHVSDQVAGIVHRDVKPDNVFLIQRKHGARVNDLHVVLLDFGIAKLRDSRGGELTRTGSVMGTPAYMAPEQLANSKVVDRRADVYALGVILFEMITGGYRPWSDENNETPAPAVIYQRQTSEPPPDPRRWNPTVSPALASVAMRAMACDPRERWPSALEFARALAEAVVAEPPHPSGNEILRRFAEDLWDPSDHRQGNRIAAAPISVVDENLWTPPPSAVSIFSGVALSAGPMPSAGPTRSLRPPPNATDSTTLGSLVGQSVPGAAPVAAGPTRRSRAPLYAAAALAVGVAGLAIGLAASGGSTRQDPTPSPAGTGATVPASDAGDARAPDAQALTNVMVSNGPPDPGVDVTSPSDAATPIDGGGPDARRTRRPDSEPRVPRTDAAPPAVPQGGSGFDPENIAQ